MPDAGSWRLKRLWIGRLGQRQRGMSPDMKRQWRGWRPSRRAVPRHRWNLSWPKSARVQHVLTASEGVRLKAESELDSIQQALAAAREACRKAEEETCRLTDERLSLIMELGAGKEELATFQAKAIEERKAMEEKFDASSDVIFNYGYGCCVFTHNICWSKPMIPTGMPDKSKPLPPEFFINPRCPPSASSDLSASTIFREEPPDLSPLAAVDRIDIPPEPPARVDEESNVAVEG